MTDMMDSFYRNTILYKLGLYKAQIDSFEFFYLDDVDISSDEYFWNEEIQRYFRLIADYGYVLLQDQFVAQALFKSVLECHKSGASKDDPSKTPKIMNCEFFKNNHIDIYTHLNPIWYFTSQFYDHPYFGNADIQKVLSQNVCTFEVLSTSSDLRYRKSETHRYKYNIFVIHSIVTGMITLPFQKERDLLNFKQYCELYKRQRITEELSGASQREAYVQDMFNEHFYYKGYLPITRAIFGNKEIDTILQDNIKQISYRNDLIIEFKQYIDEPANDRKDTTWASQLSDDLKQLHVYWKTIYEINVNISKQAYLIVFYNQKSGPIILDKKEYIIDSVSLRILMIYLGNVSPSVQKSIIVSGIMGIID